MSTSKNHDGCKCNKTYSKDIIEISKSCCDFDDDLVTHSCNNCSECSCHNNESSNVCSLCNNTNNVKIFNKEYGLYLCENCLSKFNKEIYYADNLNGINSLVRGASYMLQGLKELYGIDPNDDNFKDTPKRVARLMMELNYGNVLQAARDILNVSFPTENKYDGLVSANNIRVSSLCPHHMIVVDYDVSVAYVPSGGRFVGLSKLPRVAKTLAKSMCLQEDYTKRIVDVIEEVLKPAGCAAYVKGVHNCIQARGAEMRDISNVTIALRGVFAMNPTLKEEWLFTINDSHKSASK